MILNFSKSVSTLVLALAMVLSGAGFWQYANAAVGVNTQIPFTGTLKNSSGTLLSGTYDMVFSIYDAPTGGTTLWSGTHSAGNGNAVTVSEGIFSILLGSGAGNTLDLDFNDDTYYLGISIEADPEMSPRTRLGAAGYAFNADKLDGLSANQFIQASSTGRIEAASASSLFTLTQNGAGDIVNFYDGGSLVFAVADGGLVTASSLFNQGAYYDTTNNAGAAGYVLQSTGTSTIWVATSTLGFTGGGGGSSAWSLNGTSTYYTDGNVGIGTTDPTKALSVVGDSSVTGSQTIGGKVAIGSQSSVNNASRYVNLVETINSTNSYNFIYNNPHLQVSAPTSRESYAQYNLFEADFLQENGFDYTMGAVYGEVQIDATSTLFAAYGGKFVIDQNSSAGQLDNAYGLSSSLFVSGVSRVNNAYGLFTDISNGGVIDNYYGILIQDVFDGTVSNGYAVWVNQGDVILGGNGDGVAGGTDPGSDLFFGTGQNTALFYDGSDFYVDTRVAGFGDAIIPNGSLSLGIASTSIDARLVVGGNIRATGTINVQGTGTSTFSGDLALDETRSLSFTLPGNDGIRVFQDPIGFGYGDLAFARKDDPSQPINLAFAAGASITANSGVDGSGNYTPSLSLNSDGSVQLVNTAQGAAASRAFQINLTSGVDITQGGLRIAAGDVGVGTTTPTAQLHTTGSVRLSNFGAGTLITDAEGNVSVSSDERLKDVVEGFHDGLSAILGIEPIVYRWSEDSGLETETEYVGFSAQNVQEHIPGAVGEDNKGFLTLSDRGILAGVVNAIHEMWDSITGNKDKIASLEERIAALEANGGSSNTATTKNSNNSDTTSSETTANDEASEDAASTTPTGSEESDDTASTTESGTESEPGAPATDEEEESAADEEEIVTTPAEVEEEVEELEEVEVEEEVVETEEVEDSTPEPTPNPEP